MGILQNTSVRRQEWNIIYTGCGDDDLICRITVKVAWEFCGLNRNLRR